jgi:hypothetical protein
MRKKPSSKATKSRGSSSHPVAKSAAAHIKAAPKGPRTVSHRRIAAAVEKVFRERSLANA